MREIKFRGKYDFGKRWLYGDLRHIGNIVCIYSGTDANVGSTVDPETVGQFTGIKDITGAGIYEGDIVAFKDNETDEYTRGAVLQSVLGAWLIVFEGLSVPLWNVRKTALILSNIHDSPEFLGAINARD